MKKFLRVPERATVRIRTENLLIRNQLLYPFELWQHIAVYILIQLGIRKNIHLRTAKLRNSRCRSRTDYFKIMTLAWYSVPLICKRRMKDSNLQVVSD